MVRKKIKEVQGVKHIHHLRESMKASVMKVRINNVLLKWAVTFSAAGLAGCGAAYVFMLPLWDYQSKPMPLSAYFFIGFFFLYIVIWPSQVEWLMNEDN